jgi:hypothetical protein
MEGRGMTKALTFHPIADVFPLMQGRRFEALVEDIRANGLLHPIVIHQQKILDGRNRWRACQEAGVAIKTEEYTGTDPVRFVVTVNLARRHLSASQRAMVAARIATLKVGRPKKTQICAISMELAAAHLDVSERSVDSARVVLSSEDEKLVAAVDDDEISVSAAASKVQTTRRRAEIAEQAKAVPANGERYRLVNASVGKLLLEPASSIDLIVTDPPYPEEFLPLFGELARGAAHVLKPGGLLVCMTGQSWLPRVFAELASTNLEYLWTLAYLTPGGQATQVFPRKVNTFWKPVIVYCQGAYKGEWYGDVTKSDVNDNDKDHHHWGQSVSGMRDLMRRFVMPGHMIVDPFLGGGTTAVVALELGATFLGFDISQDAIDATRARLADAQS